MSEIQTDPFVHTCIPDGAGRQQKEMETYALLAALEIPFYRADHEEAATIEHLGAVEKVLGIEICKNLFLCNTQKTDFYLLLMPGRKVFKTKDLSRQINSARLSFADAAYMERYLNLTPGSVSVLGLMNDKDHIVRLLIDKDVLNGDYLGCHPCVNTSSLKLRMDDVLQKFLPYTGHVPVMVDL